MGNWPVLITFNYPHEAHLVKGYLESNGIETVMHDELTAQVANFYSGAIGGVKLLVRNSDFENGIQLLKKGGYLTDEDCRSESETEVVLTDKTTNKKICPFCSSDNITVVKKAGGLTAIVFAVINLMTLTGSAVPLLKSSFKCFDCNKEWIFKKHAVL